eukprot:gnl/TRDRNA2_/TRDRNA2_184644_c0_seq1.p1 gnl/TRDRNA2_/TRDRNA2_184644_c0~~gnl/TRDRNA2_/TRDRNA2_184644_c0_seq1.p1  ORF type:complete len:499 (-),score=91.31 gnl/TRDRNA2_/TRDRNA2_184644_c0_seq1:202-1698(-)
MFCVLILIAASAGLSTAGRLHTRKYGQPMKEKMPWYKSGDEIHQSLQDIASGCQGAEVQMSQSTKISPEGHGEVNLDVLRVRRPASDPKTKALLVFGEHAREVITGESAVDLVKNLCGLGSNSENMQKAKQALDQVEFVIVPNANPIARKEVEKGYYCKRTNEDNVDLNRNWGDDHREDDQTVQKQRDNGEETYPGPQGFSEPETQILRDLAQSEQPDVFVSIHSGAYLLGAPYGYTPNKEPTTREEMEEVLKPISDKYCNGNCPYGGLSELINYENHGCDLDYISEHVGTPYVFTWEIYVGESFRQTYIDEAAERHKGGGDGASAMSFVQKGSSRGTVASATKASRRMSALRGGMTMDLEAYDQRERDEDIESCLEQFNPQSQGETEQVVNNWSGAYLDLALEVAQKRHPKTGNSANATTATAGPIKEQPSRNDNLLSDIDSLKDTASSFSGFSASTADSDSASASASSVNTTKLSLEATAASYGDYSGWANLEWSK